MSSAERQSTRSPTITSRSDSYRDGPTSRVAGRPYQQRSSITEENEREDNEYEEALDDVDEPTKNELPPQRSEDQYIAALQYRFPNRPKTDYSYSKPVGPTIAPTPPAPTTTQPVSTRTGTTPGTSGTQRNGSYQSTSRPNPGGNNTIDVADDRTFQRPALRRVDPDQQNNYARRIAGETPTPTSPVKRTTPGQNVRINEGDIGTNRPGTATFTTQGGPPRTQESTFEKVPSHGGPVSYLGTGTFSQFEHCLHECLERERRQTGIASQITRHEIPSTISAHDYSYDQGLPPSSSHNILHSNVSPNFIDYHPSRSAGMFTIDDIRHINVALSRNGISLFPYERPFHHNSYPSPVPPIPSHYPSGRHGSGEVVSACRVVEEDPALLYNRNGSQAVQNVWNAIQDHSPSSYIDYSR